MARDRWREVAPIENPNATARDMRYQGMTELTRGGRSIACLGVGPAVRAAIKERMEA